MKNKIKYFRLKVCIFIVRDGASSSSFARLRGRLIKERNSDMTVTQPLKTAGLPSGCQLPPGFK